MPKSRRTKAKHQDFQKVKLKAGRSLPKGLNETKTAFKSQSIQIREQLAQDTSQPTTKRKLNIQDLLAQCQHYSSSVRQDALGGLRELLMSCPDMLSTHLAVILERTSPLCLDKDSTLRQALCRFYKAILPQVSVDQMKPFFTLLSAHLSCAMTHIQDDIQLDSLQLLDLCLDNYPSLVTGQQGTLLTNFIQQISRPSGGDASNRTLVVNPSSKISGQRWQMLVLQRLEKFLSAVIEYATGCHSSESSSFHPVISSMDGSNTDYNRFDAPVKWRDDGPTEILILNRPPTGPGFRFSTDTSSAPSSGSLGSSLHQYTVMLVPLLLQCWVEVGPSQLATDLPGNALSSDAMSTLSSILGILQLLMSGLDRHGDGDSVSWLHEKYSADFQQYFMPFFPYSMHEPLVKGKAKVKDTQQVSVLSLNLSVCDVMSQFLNASNLSSSKFGTVILDYMVQTLQTVKQSPSQIKIALRVVERLLNLPIGKDMQCDLMKAVHQLYHGQHILSAEKGRILEFFTRLVMDPHKKELQNLHPVSQWLKQLPRQLVITSTQNPSATGPLLNALLRLSVMGHSSFVKSLEDSSIQILQDCIPRSQTPQEQIKIIDLLYRVPRWTEEHFRSVASLCHEGTMSLPAFRRFLQIIMHHLSRCTVSGDELPFHIPDVFSLLIAISKGFAAQDLNKLQSPQHTSTGTSISSSLLWEPGAVSQRWNYHKQIVTEVVCVLQQFPNSEQVAHVFANYIQTWLSKKPTLPLQSMYGITQCLQAFGDTCHPINKLQHLVSLLLLKTLRILPQIVSSVEADAVQKEESLEESVDINLISSDLVQSLAGLLNTWSLEWPLTTGEARVYIEHTMQETSGEGSQEFVTMLGQLLTHPLLKPKTGSYKARLKPIAESIQKDHSDLCSQKWWINFVYELSI